MFPQVIPDESFSWLLKYRNRINSNTNLHEKRYSRMIMIVLEIVRAKSSVPGQSNLTSGHSRNSRQHDRSSDRSGPISIRIRPNSIRFIHSRTPFFSDGTNTLLWEYHGGSNHQFNRYNGIIYNTGCKSAIDNSRGQSLNGKNKPTIVLNPPLRNRLSLHNF